MRVTFEDAWEGRIPTTADLPLLSTIDSATEKDRQGLQSRAVAEAIRDLVADSER